MTSSSTSRQRYESIGVTSILSSELYPSHHQAGEDGLPMLLVENDLGRAVIALQGAHIVSFTPAGGHDLLWLSPKSLLMEGKPIRGGVPLCLPWFGPSTDGKMLHGFARIMQWSLLEAEVLNDGATRLLLSMTGDESTCELWPHAFAFNLEVTVGNSLHLRFSAMNCSRVPAPFSFIFHTYFSVPNVAEASVSGLDGVTYIDKMNNAEVKQQSGDVVLSTESVYIYRDVPNRQVLTTAQSKTVIESGSPSAVIWNAWDNAANVPDIGIGNHTGYLCVERGNVVDHALTLQPEETYEAWLTLAPALAP